MLIDRDKCCYCGACAGSCPHDAIWMYELRTEVNEEKCTRCGLCCAACPVGALELEAKQ